MLSSGLCRRVVLVRNTGRHIPENDILHSVKLSRLADSQMQFPFNFVTENLVVHNSIIINLSNEQKKHRTPWLLVRSRSIRTERPPRPAEDRGW
jgi:hypothetical protein